MKVPPNEGCLEEHRRWDLSLLALSLARASSTRLEDRISYLMVSILTTVTSNEVYIHTHVYMYIVQYTVHTHAV